MSRPFVRIMDGQESGSRSSAGTGAGAGAGAGAGNGARAGNGIGNGVGTGVRWWRNSGGAERRRESMNSNESTPKSPSQGNEMVSVSSNFAGLSPVITPGVYHVPTSNSPVYPGPQSNTTLSAPQPPPPVEDSTAPLERPRPVVVRNEAIGTGGPVMVQTQPRAQAQPRGPADIESRQIVPTEEGRWWWQRGSLKGLQTKLFICLVAGIFLAITLAIYLGLALDHNLRLRREWHILLILVVLVATVFFCHALVQLCIIATSPLRFQRTSRNFSRIPSVSGPDGYANPRQPIRIQTHFEHDVDGVEPDVTKMPPPIYGLWRCSVRVNPDQFYWVRRTSAQQSTIPGGREVTSPSGRVIPRPPSYASDDGISFSNNSFPSMGPSSSLPPHPSEVRGY